MAQNAPPSLDIQDIQFKLHDRLTVYPEVKDVKSLVSLLAVSSAKGILFAASQNSKELKVFMLRDVVDSKAVSHSVKVRVITLPGEPNVLACSCDGSLVAVNYFLNSTSFLQIYQVDSFVTPTINSLYNLPVASENNTFALQLLWNPVIPNNIALILTDGSVAMLTLSNGGQYDKMTLGKEHQVKSGCWSPKGKQIVFGFAEGKLQQFKPNLQPARAILCPPGIHAGPFDCIALHWLSTFQFAAIFLTRGQDMCPSLFIINAPKVGQPSFINYFDVCYSAPGPRIHQLSFHHISQWNILLVTSANGVEVGVLGTNDTGETPSWIQYTLLDEARIEMPLTESKDETYPLGFAFDTASSHQVVIGEKKLPVMPMIHVLSTHGHLVSYNFLNLSPQANDICSPPPPLNDISGQFVNLSETLGETSTAGSKSIGNTSELSGLNENAFVLGSNAVTSTPTIKDKPPLPVFASQPAVSKPTTGFSFPAAPAASLAAPTAVTNKSATAFGFGTANSTASNAPPFQQQFGGMTTGTPFGGFAASGFSANRTSEPNNQPAAQKPISINQNVELNKPLYTVPPTFTPPSVAQQQQLQQQHQQHTAKTEGKLVKPASNQSNLNMVEIDEVVKQMIIIQIHAFENELRQIRHQSNQLLENIGSPNEMKSCTKQLNDLQEIIEQANDHEFERDVQSLRHSMNESYAMLAECRTKLDLYNNPNLIRLSAVASTDPTSRRQLAKLQAYTASNQNQLYHLNQSIDAQWSQYQDVVRRNSKNQMHIPCLDGIYQRMSKLKDLLARQRTKMNYIQTKLKQKGLNYKPANDIDLTYAAVRALTKHSSSTMESLADSVLSMSLSKVVSQTRAKLSEEKLNAIRNYTKRQQQIAIIKPKRPDRVGLRSEVILETKLESERKQKEVAKKQVQQQLYQQQYLQQQQQFAAYKTPINMQPSLSSKMPQQLKSQANQQPVLAKPTASKPIMVSSQPPTFITPTSATAATLSFGGNSSFVKTSTSAPKTQEEAQKPVVATSTAFAGFGKTTSQTGLNFNLAKPMATSTANDGGKENKFVPTPISFSPKVIGGNDAKPFANLGNKITQSNLVQGATADFNAANSSGFSAFTTTNPKPQTGNQDKTKKSEETSKQFGFITTTTTSAPSTTATAPAPPPAVFAGFPPSSKSTSTAAPFATPLFSSNTINNSSASPFSALSSASPFSFNATVITSSSTTAAASNSATKNSYKALANTTTSSQSAEVTSTKPTETKTNIVSAETTTSSATASTESFSLNSSAVSTVTTTAGTTSLAAPNVAAISPAALPEEKTAVAAPASSNTPTSTEDIDDSLLNSLNICQPSAKEAGDTNKSGNSFSGFAVATSSAVTGPFSFASAGGAGDGAKPFSSSTNANTGTTTSSAFSFVSAANTTPTVGNIFAKPAATSATEPTSPTESSSSAASTVVAQPATGAAATTKATATPSSFSFTSAAAASTPDSLFGSLSVSPSTAAPPTTVAVTTAGNIFSSGSSVFEQATGEAITSTSSLFVGGPAIASTAPSLFASATPAAATAAGSIFAAAASATPQTAGSIFAGIPKPEQSVFNAASINNQPAGTGLFAAAAAHSQPAPATGGSIFGGGATGFGGPASGSIFGGGTAAASSPFTPAATANTAGSLFASAAATNKPPEGGSIFGSPTQQAASSGGSIFSKSSFGGAAAPQSAGSIFQSPSAGGFGASGGSIFGGSGPTNTSPGTGGSLFSAAAAATAPGFGTTNTSPAFGAFSQPNAAAGFGSPPASGFGAPAPTAFSSPQQQQSAFNKPLFGGQATFGSPQTAFGAQPTFGGAPTFGSPKGFGSFAVASPAASNFGAPPQAAATAAASTGNIFETLGSQDSGLSFGNLAHSTQAPQQKPSFGGSSFMNYRS